ncbi:MAG: hypothetical protein HGA24_12590, partial [Candidatus Aminicenantes bacterium]|nr:hypothetical protein [Candidatus Aminicenantes bacterium]
MSSLNRIKALVLALVAAAGASGAGVTHELQPQASALTVEVPVRVIK